jgi:hypothetical protein
MSMIDCLSTPLSVIYALEKMHVPSSSLDIVNSQAAQAVQAVQAVVHIVFIGTSSKVRE